MLLYPKKKLRLRNDEVEAVRQAHYDKQRIAALAAAKIAAMIDKVLQPTTSLTNEPPPNDSPPAEVSAIAETQSPSARIPANWRELKWPEMRDLAASLAGVTEIRSRAEARIIIECNLSSG
jgi:hypothetical protein